MNIPRLRWLGSGPALVMVQILVPLVLVPVLARVHGPVLAVSAQVLPDFTKVNAAMAKFTAATPGCAVAASVNGTSMIRKAWGMADLEHDVPNTPDTIFEAGSVSKQFTAAAVALLARDGKLSLADPVRKYVPELPDYGVPLTIDHMLRHQSGLRDWGSLEAIAGWPRGTRAYTHDHVLEIVSRQKALNFTPGAAYSYSNTGYNLAAIIVTRVSGMPFAEFTRQRIFEPLGMTRTSWRDDYRRVVKGRAIAYARADAGYRQDMPFEYVHGNGGLLTTVGDLLVWNANFTSPRVGDAASVTQQETSRAFNDGTAGEYGLGLFLTPYKGQREIGHSGSTAGYRAHLLRNPDIGTSVAVLCNAADGNATQVAHLVDEAIAPGAFRESAFAPAAARDPWSLAKGAPSPVWADYVGAYVSDEIETTLTGAVRANGVFVLKRRPADEIVLTVTQTADVFGAGTLGEVTFHRDRSGRVTSLSVKQDRVWKLVFERR